MYKETEYNHKKYLAVHQHVRIELNIEYDVSIDNIKDLDKKRDAIVEAIKGKVGMDIAEMALNFGAILKDWYIL